MATIEVNSQKIQFKEEEFLNFKSVVPKLLKEFPLTEYMIDSISINGKSLESELDSPELYNPIDKDDLLRIHFSKKHSLRRDLLNDIHELIDQILNQIQMTSFHLKQDEFFYSSLKLTKIIEAIDLLLVSTNHLIQEVKDEIEFEQTPIKELQIHLLSVIRAISKSEKDHDYIMLTDLLEYELKDNLTQWKILILPILKKEII